ncbi:MAG: NAD(P)/FAD-dependent oxidoreductase, partial [Firmicutes bacterium]|nr:NAD(P)/FAD-dependent oxidoreductase [Bacillota bacterium]
RKGYTMDGCIHWLMSCQPGSAFRQMYDELGCFVGNRLMILNDYCRFYDENSGSSLDFSSDFKRLAASMHRLAPEDTAAIDEFIRCCLDLRGFDTGIPEPLELMNPGNSLRMMWQMRPLLKYILKYDMTVGEYAQRFQNNFLRSCIRNLFLPDMPAYFIFVVLGQLLDGQLGCVEGASLRFSDAIARRYQGLGGEISYQALVEKIIVHDNQAVGVELADGSQHFAATIVSAADAHATIFTMLGGRYVDDSIRNRFKQWPLFNPIMLLTYGVAREYTGEKPSHFISLKQPLTILGQEVQSLHLRIFNYDSTLAPAGKTVLQVTVESDYDAWMELEKDEIAYAAEKARVAAQVLERLEELYPGTAPKVEVTDVATPFTFWHYTRNYRASYEGWLMTKTAVQTMLPKTLPGLSNFYMAGQWVEPGGGIPPVLYSGRNVVKILCKKEGRPFRTMMPTIKI